jgi:hypothetical protein
MNWAAAVILLMASPLFVISILGHHWAEIAFKVYIWTAAVFVCILFFIERPGLKRKWLWMGMIPLTVLHSVLMYGLVVFNEAFPTIDQVPVATYGAMLPLIALEVGILSFILDKFRPKKDSRDVLPATSEGDSKGRHPAL